MILRSIAVLFFSLVLSVVSLQARATPDSARLLDQWKSMKISSPGVYTTDEWTYVYVTRAWNESTIQQHRRWARMESARLLYAYVLNQHLSKLSEAEQIALKVYKGKLDVTGSVVLSTKKEDLFVYVFAVNTSELEKFTVSLTSPKVFKEISHKIYEHPTAAEGFFNLIASKELSLITGIHNYRGQLFNVSDPAIDQRTYSENATKYFQLRDGVLKTEFQNTDSLLRKTFDCTWKKSGFLNSLQKEGISLYPVNWQTPILKQVEACQGFVRFDSRINSREPAMMPYVRKLFSAGQDLEVAIALLEYGAEVSPRSSEVWEYLTAAYDAAGQKNASHLCARVWFTLSGSTDAFVTLLKMAEMDGEKKVSSFLDLYQ